MDFLLIVVRQYLRKNSPNTKIILMSATMDSNHFARYFEEDVDYKVPILRMDVDGPYKITTHFLDSLDVSQKIVEFENPGISDELMHLAANIGKSYIFHLVHFSYLIYFSVKSRQSEPQVVDSCVLAGLLRNRGL